MNQSKDLYFRKAKVIVNDWWVVVGDKPYRVNTISSAKVTVVRHPVNWLLFVRDEVLIFLAALLVSLVVYYLFHLQGGGLLGLWLLYAISDALSTHAKSREYTLYLNTEHGREEIAKMNDGAYLHVIASEVNRRIARQQALPGH